MMLTSYENLTSDKILFHEAKEYKVKDSKFKYQRVKIETKYSNEKKGDLIIETAFLFSFGVNKKKSQETDKLIGYSIPFCLWEKDGQPNLEEKAFFEAISKITEICQQHLEEKFGPDMASTLNTPLYYKQVEYVDKKGKKETKRDEQLLQFFMQNLFIPKNQRKFFLFLQQRENKQLILFIFVNSTAE